MTGRKGVRCLSEGCDHAVTALAVHHLMVRLVEHMDAAHPVPGGHGVETADEVGHMIRVGAPIGIEGKGAA